MTATNGQPTPWQLMIQRSFLSLYLLPNVEIKKADKFQGYDYVFEFADATLYLLIEANVLQTSRPQVQNSQVHELRKQTVNQQIKRHAQLYQKNTKGSDSPTSEKPVFFVGLTSLSIQQAQEMYTITHQYGSTFFAEECVLDLDNEDQVLQIFSLQSFVDIITRLQTPSDLNSFLQYHRTSLVQQRNFNSESELLEHFLRSPVFYQRAINVQKQLIEIGLLDEVEPRLLQTLQLNQTAHMQALSEQLQKNTAMWYKLINGLTKRLYQVGAPLPADLVKKLIAESMYTRTCLMEEILAYTDVSTEERQQGYVRHQHSYNAFGRHYMLVFYGQDPNSALSANTVRAQYHDMLFEVNSQLQDPVMDDLFLIGVNFSAHEETGNTEVQIEIYHQEGSKLTADVQRLYAQLAQLKTQS